MGLGCELNPQEGVLLPGARDGLIHDPCPVLKVSHMVPTLECPSEPRKDGKLGQGLTVSDFPLLPMTKSCLWQRMLSAQPLTLKPASNVTHEPIAHLCGQSPTSTRGT